jgi:hypothetical protein
MLFDTTHILYLIISYLLIAGILVFCFYKIKQERYKIFILKFSAIITVILHFSSLWVDFFQTGRAEVQSPMLLPIYPCNVCMWLLLVCAFCKNRQGVVYRVLTEYTFWAGVVCGTIGILLNENYASTPSLLDYEVLKGLLSHSTMVLGCLYLLVGGFVKIRVFNTVSAICGLLFFLVDGAIINTLYAVFDLSPCNSMYMLEPPFDTMPWLTPYLMGVVAVLLVFGVTTLYEYLTLPKEERWYNKLKNYKNNKEN